MKYKIWSKLIVIGTFLMIFISISIPLSTSAPIKILEIQSSERDSYFEIPTQVTVVEQKHYHQKLSPFHSMNQLDTNQIDIEIDFNNLDYGTVVIGVWKVIAGDHDMGTPTAPTIRNNGDEPIYIYLRQDHMGFGKTGDDWNVNYGVRLGATGTIVYYYPEQTIKIPEPLQPGETQKIDFYIKVIKGSPQTYEGTMNLSGNLTQQNDPPLTPTIQGPTKGFQQFTYDYQFTSSDPENDTIAYRVNWGDGITTDWIIPFPNNELLELNHTYISEGIYNIIAQAQDNYGHESTWSPPHSINITHLSLQTTLLFGLINNTQQQSEHYIFDVKTVLSLTFNPIDIQFYNSNETLIISKNFMGLFKQQFIFGFFNVQLLT